MKPFDFKLLRCACAGVTLMFGLTVADRAFAAQEERFATPEAAVQSLTNAVEQNDRKALDTIFGPELHSLVSADAVQASNRFAVFARRVSEKVSLVRQRDNRIVLEVGRDAWPAPIPLVLRDGQWFFDTDAGKEEILNRRIGWNELQTIQVCHEYVQAQREYASESHDGDEVLQFAQYLRSDSGRHNGLYWHAAEGDEISPFGPLLAAAHEEGYHKTTKIMATGSAPYHGYYFKILTRQGPRAPGGKYSYIINGRMIAGFALVAWPAEWGNSGVMTFIVNQQGKVYEKCLGAKTASLAKRMTAYDPDSSWKLTRAP